MKAVNMMLKKNDEVNYCTKCTVKPILKEHMYGSVMMMNREIKFRAWDKEYEEFIYDYRVYLDNHGTPYADSTIYGMTDITEEVEILRYTGLKDKNGTEIYEGDILSTDLDRPYLIVEFRNGAFMFQCHDNGKDYYDFMATTGENYDFTKYHEVIGNIYENRKLLERDGE